MFSVFALRLPRLLPTLPQLAAEEARKGGDQQKNARDHGVTVGKLEGSLGLLGGQLGLNRSRLRLSTDHFRCPPQPGEQLRLL